MDYVWLNGRLIGRIAGGQAYAIHDDQTGRPEAMTDASRTVVWRAQNFAFTQSVVIGTQTLNVGFPGQYYDVEASAWNNGYRDYKSGLGRYIESDPIGLGGGINTYAYAINSPLSKIDPRGLISGVFQFSGTAVAANLGGSGSAGVYVTLRWAPRFIDAGVYASGGPAIQGGNGGTSEQAGLIKGDVDDIRGVSSNYEADVPGGGVTLNYDSEGKFSGILVGPAEEIGVAQNQQTTVAYGLNDLGSYLGITIYNYFHHYNPNCP